MTSATDEIRNLRAGLMEVARYCDRVVDAESKGEPSRLLAETLGTIAWHALDKTPPASKVTHPDTLRLDWVLRECPLTPTRLSHEPPIAEGLYTRDRLDVVIAHSQT